MTDKSTAVIEEYRTALMLAGNIHCPPEAERGVPQRAARNFWITEAKTFIPECEDDLTAGYLTRTVGQYSDGNAVARDPRSCRHNWQ